MSGLKINFSKCEIITTHGYDILDLQFAELFNCQIGKFPIKYLGVLVSPRRLHVKDWDPLVERNGKKNWQLGRVGPCLLLVEQP